VGDGGDLESRSSMTKNKDEIRVVDTSRCDDDEKY